MAIVFAVWWLVLEQFRHEWARCGGASAFRCPYFLEYCYLLEIWCLIISASPPVLCSMVNLWYILTGFNSSETVILTVIWDMFWHERVECRPTDSTVRPKSLNHIHTLIIETLSTYETSQEPPQWTKLMIVGTNFGRYFSFCSGSVGSNFGMIEQDTAVSLPSAALK